MILNEIKFVNAFYFSKILNLDRIEAGDSLEVVDSLDPCQSLILIFISNAQE